MVMLQEGNGNWLIWIRIRISQLRGKLDATMSYPLLFYIKKWRLREVKWLAQNRTSGYLLRKTEKQKENLVPEAINFFQIACTWFQGN